MKLEKKYLVLSIIGIILLLGGITYAFFKVNIIGEGKVVSLKSKGIYLEYKGDLSITNGYIEPGWSITKTFSVENQGNNTETYDIYIKDLINTFVTGGYLQYKITSPNGYNMTNYMDIPKSAVATDTVLAYSVSIDPSTTHTYTIELIYKDTTEDQSADMGKILSGTLNIKEGTNNLPEYDSNTLAAQILLDNPTVSTRTDFSVTNTANTTGTIYETDATEDGNVVYYYSGNTTNNWVKFGKVNITESESGGDSGSSSTTGCSYGGKTVYNINSEANSADINSNLESGLEVNTGKTDIIVDSDLNPVTTESICLSSNVCNYNGNYYVGFEDMSICLKMGGTDTGNTATWNDSTLGSGTSGSTTSTTEKDIYWRIIRTNADGSIRLLYAGTSPNTTEGYIGKSEFNSEDRDPMYVGYSYGTSGTLASNRTNETISTIAGVIQTWYENNLLINYDKYISKTAIYCNDRSIGSGTYNTGSTEFHYGAFTRLHTNKTPTYKCGGNGTGGLFESTQAVEDKFSASTTSGGNGQLTYPIALMTADELAFAGGVLGTSLPSPYAWYYTNSAGGSITGNNLWWTMSPSSWLKPIPTVFLVINNSSSGSLEATLALSNVNSSVRPVLSLKSCTTWSSGNGTSSNPYVVSVSETCASAEN